MRVVLVVIAALSSWAQAAASFNPAVKPFPGSVAPGAAPVAPPTATPAAAQVAAPVATPSASPSAAASAATQPVAAPTFTQSEKTVTSTSLNSSISASTSSSSSAETPLPEGRKFQGLAELLKMRDPFRPPLKGIDLDSEKSEIEKTDVVQFSMIGVMAGFHHPRVILRSDRTGKIFLVAEGTKIGPHNGYVRKILEDRVIINENTTDLLGEKEVVTTEIKLAPVKAAKGTIFDVKTTAIPGAAARGGSQNSDSSGGNPPLNPSGYDSMGQPIVQPAPNTGAGMNPSQDLIQQAQALMNGNVTGFTASGAPAIAAPAAPAANSQINTQGGGATNTLVMPPPPDQVAAPASNSAVAPNGAGAVK